MSTRAIASAPGIPQRTVSDNLPAERNRSTEDEPEVIVGVNGKKYTAKPRKVVSHE